MNLVTKIVLRAVEDKLLELTEELFGRQLMDKDRVNCSIRELSIVRDKLVDSIELTDLEYRIIGEVLFKYEYHTKGEM